ncbi:transposase [Neisseria mucosa]|nr:transposase [Neisseria mucosa]
MKAQISGKRYRRLSLVSAQVGNRLIAPMVYQNTMTGVFFEAWFQQCLLPALTQKSVIILDNARFHHMGVLREMAEKLGHKVLPLAPYSPELNPIEKVWANIKRYLRTVLLITPDLTMRYCPILILIDYNIEIQIPKANGSVKTIENLHIVPNSSGGFTWWGKDGVTKK